MPQEQECNTFGWQFNCHTECDRCHHEKPCCSVDFEDGSSEWDYCKSCWTVLSERGVFEGVWQ